MMDSTGAFYFLEMNTRIQVEHPVTEAVTGLDLVALQIRIAAGEAIPFEQSDVKLSGHAIEARIYAEDPDTGFVPSPGPILAWRAPEGPGIRLDAGFEAGQTVTPHYDAMLAKLIVTGRDREEALARLARALEAFWVAGIKTGLPFLRRLAANPGFAAGAYDTGFLEAEMARAGSTLAAPRALDDENARVVAGGGRVADGERERGRRRRGRTRGGEPLPRDAAEADAGRGRVCCRSGRGERSGPEAIAGGTSRVELSLRIGDHDPDARDRSGRWGRGVVGLGGRSLRCRVDRANRSGFAGPQEIRRARGRSAGSGDPGEGRAGLRAAPPSGRGGRLGRGLCGLGRRGRVERGFGRRVVVAGSCRRVDRAAPRSDCPSRRAARPCDRPWRRDVRPGARSSLRCAPRAAPGRGRGGALGPARAAVFDALRLSIESLVLALAAAIESFVDPVAPCGSRRRSRGESAGASPAASTTVGSASGAAEAAEASARLSPRAVAREEGSAGQVHGISWSKARPSVRSGRGDSNPVGAGRFHARPAPPRSSAGCGAGLRDGIVQAPRRRAP
jgi:hypothetical protein